MLCVDAPTAMRDGEIGEAQVRREERSGAKKGWKCAVKVERAPRTREKESRDLVSSLQRTPLADVHDSLSEDLPED